MRTQQFVGEVVGDHEGELAGEGDGVRVADGDPVSDSEIDGTAKLLGAVADRHMSQNVLDVIVVFEVIMFIVVNA